jgi:uncharacterized membrane protein
MPLLSLSTTGRAVFTAAVVGFGALFLGFAAGLESPVPGPPWLLAGRPLAGLVGSALLASSVGLWAKRFAALSTFTLAALFLAFGLVRAVELIDHLRDPGPWTSSAELISLGGASLTLAGHRLGRWLFAVPLTVFGVQHLMYLAFVATLVPAWFPARTALAALTGVAFFAAALSLTLGVRAQLAGRLLALMFAVFVVTTHVPRVAAAAANGNEWTSLLVALAFCGASLVAAQAARLQRAS